MMAMVRAVIENDNNGGSVGGGGSQHAMEAAEGHCHKAARAEANLSVLGIPPESEVVDPMESRRHYAVSAEESLGREDSACSNQ